jgi:hypothetical protein
MCVGQARRLEHERSVLIGGSSPRGRASRSRSGCYVSLGVDRVRRHRQAEALLDVLDQLSLLPVGVLRATQRDQNVIGLEGGDGVAEDGQDAATEGVPASAGADRAHVAEHGVEALVSDMPTPIDIIGQPRKPARQAWSEDVKLGRCVDHGTHSRRQLAHLGDGGVGDEEEPPDRGGVLVRLRVEGFDVRAAHGWLTACGPADGRSITFHVSW